MNGELKRNFVNVTAVHVVAMVLLLLATGFRTIFGQKPPPVPITEFVVDVTSPDDVKDFQLPDFRPPPEPEPDPPDIPDVVPLPEKKQTPKTPEKVKPKTPEKEKPKPDRKIAVSRKLVTRTRNASSPSPKPGKRLTKEEIERLLRMGAKPGDHTVIPLDEEVRCYSVIRQTFYDTWAQPSREEVPPGVTAEVSIRLLWDGTVADRSLSRKSGNAILDASVMRALGSIKRIDGVTRDFVRKHDTVTIAFKLED